MDPRHVVLVASVVRGLPRLPLHIRQKLQSWVAAVEAQGLHAVRRIPGYHDEPLAGRRAGQRSIRLSKSYRAVYTLPDDGSTIQIEEVTKHAY